MDRLDAIIEDLLKLSRIEQEAEREELVLEEARIKEILLAAIQVCQVKATPPQISAWNNATKYSDAESKVQVEARKANNEILIRVRDQGWGIDKKYLFHLFERFYRVDKARGSKRGGTGLGLAIVKHIAQAHGGYVTVESAPGKGSTFSLRLPTISN